MVARQNPEPKVACSSHVGVELNDLVIEFYDILIGGTQVSTVNHLHVVEQIEFDKR